MNVRPLGDASGLEGETKGPLERGAAHRFGGGLGAPAAVTFGGKEPERMAMGFPFAELAQTGVVSRFGARADGQELQIVGVGIEDGVRGTFFIGMTL